MRSITCAEARTRLSAFRDEELGVAERVTVRSHLSACPACSAELDSLHRLGEALKAASLARIDGCRDDVATLHHRVMPGVVAERQQQMGRRLERWRDDLPLVWALGAATVASLACLFAGFGMMRLTLREAPSSMSAVIGALATPGSDRNPMRLDGRVLRPTFGETAPAIVMTSDEEVLALSAVVTREGRVSRVELVMPAASRLPHDEAVMELLDAAAQARFEPARSGGSPVAVSVIWLLAHTTVIGKHEDVIAAPRIRRSRPAEPVSAVPPAEAPISQFEDAGQPDVA
jgi:hypothetical protein